MAFSIIYPYCTSSRTRLQPAMYKEKAVEIQDGQEITREIEVYRCLDCGRVFEKEEDSHG